MKILITTDAYYPMTSGVVISTDILCNQLRINGHDVKVLALSYTGKDYIKDDVYYLSSFNANIYPNARITKPRMSKLVRELIRWKPDIIHSQTEFTTMIVAKYIRARLKIPQIHTYHTMYEDYLKYIFKGKVLKKGTMARLTRILLNTFNVVIAPTEKVKDKLISYKVSTDIKVVPTGIDIEKFQNNLTYEEKQDLLLKYGLKVNDKILIFVGRIAEEKNIQELLYFYKQILNKIPEMKFLIVGGGPYLPNLKKIVAELDIEQNVIFTGMIDSDNIYKYYQLGTVFLTGSKSETQGLTYLEALASGCPVVCRWDLCVKDLIIDGETGFTYNNGEELEYALKKILLNDEFRQKIQKNSVIKAQSYSKENFAKNILAIYNEEIAKETRK
jgi:1,2-diacylglycerol 3-alpha-glucosyltransferase